MVLGSKKKTPIVADWSSQLLAVVLVLADDTFMMDGQLI